MTFSRVNRTGSPEIYTSEARIYTFPPSTRTGQGRAGAVAGLIGKMEGAGRSAQGIPRTLAATPSGGKGQDAADAAFAFIRQGDEARREGVVGTPYGSVPLSLRVAMRAG